MTDSRTAKVPGDTPVCSTSAPAPRRAETRSERKRRDVFEAARALFAEKGYAATSIDMVAERAGVSKATIYGHFKNKDDLFSAAVRAQAENFTSHTCEVLSLPAAEGIRTVAKMYLDMVTAPDAISMHRAIAAEGRNFPELASTFYDCGPARVCGIMEEYLRCLDARGDLRVPDPALAAEMFLGMLRVAFFRAIFGLNTEPLCRDVVVNEAVRIMLAAYAMPTGAVQEQRE